MDYISIALWSGMVGWVLRGWPARPTDAHRLGLIVVKLGQGALNQAKFVGGGFRVVHSCTIKVDGEPLTMALSRDGEDATQK